MTKMLIIDICAWQQGHSIDRVSLVAVRIVPAVHIFLNVVPATSKNAEYA